MKKSNKEVIDQITDYFMKQEKRVVCKCLAGLMIDFNRLHHLEDLGEDEKSSLIIRTGLNLDQLYRFIENGPTTDFELKIMNSDEN